MVAKVRKTCFNCDRPLTRNERAGGIGYCEDCLFPEPDECDAEMDDYEALVDEFERLMGDTEEEPTDGDS